MDVDFASGRVDAPRPHVLDERRVQDAVVQAPLAVADERLDEVRRLPAVRHRDGTGSRAGGRSRSGTAGGCLGTTGGACVGS
jgi:hypothetical protein